MRIPIFTARDLREQDLPECLSIDPPHSGEEIIGFERAAAVWRSLIVTCAFGGGVIEVDPPQAGLRIAGFGARLFVSRDFAEGELANPRPGLNARLVAAIEAGQPVALNEAQIRYANTHCGLDAVTLTVWRRGMLSEEAFNTAAALMASRFFEGHRGYWLHRMISEIASEEYRKLLAATGVWRIVSSFETFYARHPGSPWSPGRALAIITRNDALAVVGHPIGPLFVPKKPQWRLRDADRHFLRAAAGGLTDEELSRDLDIGVSSVKKRWLSLFERISDASPNFFPRSANWTDRQTRGRQKRHLVVAYIRSHPEELCPFEW